MTGYIPRRVKRFILEAHGGVCFYCSAPATSVDHIVPQRAGGTHDLTNLIAACRWCNSRKNGWELPSVRLQKALEAAAAVAPTVRKQEELAVKDGTANRVAALSRAAAARSPNGTAPMSVRVGASV